MIIFVWLFLTVAILVVPPRISHTQEKNVQVPTPAVTLDLVTRKQNLAVGERWAVYTAVSNKSDVAIWIAAETSLLTIPTELLGQSRRFFSQFAFLPTLGDKVSDQTIRINPGEAYVIGWYVDGLDNPGSTPVSLATRLLLVFQEFLLFKPDEYPVSATVHYWKNPPVIKNGRFDLSESNIVSQIRLLRIDGSPLVLVLGAALGGWLAFTVESFASYRRSSANLLPVMQKYFIGLIGTMVFCGVGIILLERLAKSEFPVAVAVKDFWGAIAIGLIFEWWGLKALRHSFRSKVIDADEPTSNNTQRERRDESPRPST